MTLDEQARAILESNLTEIKPEIIDNVHNSISKIIQWSYTDGFWDGHKKASEDIKNCDRNICISNEYNGIGCDECEVTKSRER